MDTQVEVGVLQKAYDIEPGDDFYARFLMGLCDIRSCAYRKDKQLEYDKSFHPVYQNLLEMKMLRDKCLSIVSNHLSAVQSGADGRYNGHHIDIDKPLDDELNIFFKDFFIRGQMVIGALIKHSIYMGSNIGFLFAEEKKFHKGLKDFVLKEDDERFESLNNFVVNHKIAWYSSFRELRRQIEHEGWSLPRLRYSLDENQKVQIHLPILFNQSLDNLLNTCWENMTLFCEEVIVFLLSLKLRDDMVIVYIPEKERNQNIPVRYIVSHKDFPGVLLQCG